jgi:phosphoenolpyruvate-protein kinase (PTS system EI component)
MEILKGIGVSPGVYIGEAFLLETEEVRIANLSISEAQVAAEIRELIDRILSSYDEMDRRFTTAGGLGESAEPLRAGPA